MQEKQTRVQRWWILFAMISAIAMIFIDQTILPLTLPTIQRELGVSDVVLQWTINGYTLALTASVMACGRMGDLFGHRALFCVGAILFALASVFTGFAYFGWWLIAGRALQGLAGAMMAPASLSIIVDNFPQNLRGRAMGIYVSAGTIFLAVGPFVGGFFTQYLTWRLVFWMNLPIACVGVVLALLFVPKSEKIQESFSIVSTLLFGSGIIAMIIAIMQGQSWGWGSVAVLSLFFLSVILFTLFYYVDQKQIHPLFDLSLFRREIFRASNVILFCIQFVLMITVFWSIFFQNILGYTPMQAGLITLGSTFPIIGIAPLAGWMHDRFGLKGPTLIGVGMVLFCFLWFCMFNGIYSFWVFLPALLCFGSGMALVYTPLTSGALGNIPSNQRGAASGVLSTTRFLGASIGLALLGSIFGSIEDRIFKNFLESAHYSQKLSPDLFEGLLSKNKTAMHLLATLPDKLAQEIREVLQGAFLDGFFVIHIFCFAFVFIVFLYTLFVFKSKKQK